MDAKESRTARVARNIDGRKIVNFVGDVKQELKKVEWTGKDELKVYTKIVVISTFVFAMFVYFSDLIIQGVLGGINLLLKFITG